ncbi:MAG: hypothetical protein OEY29_13275 [Gammaproteobacteria bacterium]|nr:hypothetical protein [Gammaproteobacteria bacterium]
MKRRMIIQGLLGLFTTSVAGTALAQLKPIGTKKNIKSGLEAGRGLSPAQVLANTRLSLGLQNAADISDAVSSKMRVADELVQGLSDSELSDRQEGIKLYASNTVLELMGTEAYTHQSQVDMKFILIPAAGEIESTIAALKDGSIDVAAAQLAIRSTFGRFLDGLEQVPAN